MSNLFIVRHGSYDKQTGSLDDSGKLQIGRVSEFISGITRGEYSGSSILTSPRLRAIETAQIISRGNGDLSIRELDQLGREPTWAKEGEIHELLHNPPRGALIIVTHEPFANYCVYTALERHGESYEIGPFPMGFAVYINRRNGERQTIE